MDSSPDVREAGLARRLGLFHAAMVVMGGIVGAGIFMNPSVVARQVRDPLLILGAWVLGGVVALFGAFIYAELAARRPHTGGQYAYLRDAFHPSVGFLYGWTLLLVIQTGGMAAVALTFARYFLELTHLPFNDWLIALVVLGTLVLINCLGVRAGSWIQSVLMILKIGAIGVLILAGFFWSGTAPATEESTSRESQSILTALIPVLFAYGGWQTANFIAGEVQEPEKNLSRGLILGVSGVIFLYFCVNAVCVRVLGSAALAATSAPASSVMRIILGEPGAKLIAVGISVSTLGFLSQGMLTAPRVYFAMAEDGLFFKRISWVHPGTRVPVFAIVLQGILAGAIAVSGKYEQILSYVVSADFLFFGLTAVSVFVFRRRETNHRGSRFIPGHPVTTLFFIGVSWMVVFNTLYRYPENTGIGFLLIAAGIPAYIFWRRTQRK